MHNAYVSHIYFITHLAPDVVLNLYRLNKAIKLHNSQPMVVYYGRIRELYHFS